MNILVLIKKLDQTQLEREIRNGDAHGDIISFYNETDGDYTLTVDGTDYKGIVQVCIILKESSYYSYIQYGENPNFVKLNVDNINEISLMNSI